MSLKTSSKYRFPCKYFILVKYFRIVCDVYCIFKYAFLFCNLKMNDKKQQKYLKKS